MKFDARSKTLLAITKSKAKMFEFELPEADHIDLEYSPSNLLVMTIGMLGDLCRLELSDEDTEADGEPLQRSKVELRNVARYFDALDEAKLEDHYSYYLKLLGASAYYLADMPGSSTILTAKAKNLRSELTENGLETLLEWVLDGSYEVEPEEDEFGIFSQEALFFLRYLRRYFKLRMLPEGHLLHASNELRKKVHMEGTDRELLLVDAICAIAVRRMNSSSMAMLPEATSLPLSEWRGALQKETFIKEFWPAQRLLAAKGVFRGRSAVVQLPTSAGKTKSCEIIIRSAFLAGRAQLVVLVAPYRSLCREIKDAFSLAFADEDISVDQLNDTPQIDEWDEEILKSIFGEDFSLGAEEYKSIIVSTPEKLVYLLRHRPALKQQIGLLIFDEGHQFDTGARGVTYELLLANLKRSVSPKTQMVLISAVISNASSIGDWLFGGEGEVVDGASCLATERSIAFSSWKSDKGQLHYINPSQPEEEEFFVPRVLERAQLPLKGRERKQKYFPEKDNKGSVAAYLAFKLTELGPVAVFCGTKKSVTTICKLMLAAQDRLDNLVSPAVKSDEDEIRKIHYLAIRHFGKSYVLTKAIKEGVLPHSASIPNGIRVSVEYAMENALARCVICTSTLAQGVNLPIKYLVISGVFQGQKRISVRDFHNLIGRAGRAGKHTEGSIIFSDTEIYDQRKNRKRLQWNSLKQLLDPSQSEKCVSSLKTLIEPFENDPFRIDPIKFVNDPKKIRDQYIRAANRQKISSSDIDSILSQMRTREGYIHSVESYLLALPNANEEEFSIDAVLDILRDTLAYFLSSPNDKKSLLKVFEIIFSSVEHVPAQKRSGFGKALLGIQSLERIEAWLSENIENLDSVGEVDILLEKLWPILDEIVDSLLIKKISPADAPLTIAKNWCLGKSYHELLSLSIIGKYEYQTEKRSTNLSMAQIVELCDTQLGYKVMLVVGAIADLLEAAEAEVEIVEKIRHLQTTLKLGIGTKLEHWLYAKGLVDREICKDIGGRLESLGYNSNEFPFDLLRKERAVVGELLQNYPAFFSTQVVELH